MRATCALMIALISMSSSACSSGDGKPSKPAAKDVANGDVSDVGSDSGIVGDGSTQDVAVDTVTTGTDALAGDGAAVDAGPECSAASDCDGKVSAKKCEQAVCQAGVCGLQLKPDTCCEDKHCNDGAECTLDQCDSAKNACQHTPVVNCCSGKVSVMKLGFEQGTIGDLTGTVAKGGSGPGAVAWTVSDKRARVGSKALHLTNACGNYDTSADPAAGCTTGKGATPVSATLATKGISLPKDKATMLHFWLWLGAEPMYADTLPAGSCKTPCPAGASCVSVNGASQCIPEKDVLTVTVISDKGASKVFDSTTIGKSTGGKWRHVAIDLSTLAGMTVNVQWRFETATGIKNDFEGVWLDHIAMETVCPVKGTLCAKDAPCLDDSSVCTSDTCTYYSNNQVKGFCFHDKAVGCCTLSNECDDGSACTIDTCNSGVCASKPDASNPSCCKPSISLVEDFNSGVLTEWKLLEGNSKNVHWRINPKGGTKGSQALYFGDSTFSSYADASLAKGEGPKGIACSKPVKLKVGTLYNRAVFQLQMETEWSYLPKAIYKNPPLAGQPKYDHLAIEVRTAAKTTEAWSSNLIYGTTNGIWREIVVDLDPWQGQEIQVCIAFDAGDDQVNDKAGIVVDDLSVRVACSKSACYYDAECAGSCPTCQAPGCADGTCGCVPLPGCCTKTTDCDDGQPCTLDSCVQSQCKHTPQKECCTSDSQCSSKDVCAKATCNKSTHSCAVDAIAGCCKTDQDCTTQLACVTTSCDQGKNQCVDKPIAGCCVQDSSCDDKDACTKDLCIDGKCTYQPSGQSGCS
ncbi:MAG: hypothetical protein KC502_02935 [Myxococcales bacterium]|nr:hypothetical protein [Myxococcales bacterium]